MCTTNYNDPNRINIPQARSILEDNKGDSIKNETKERINRVEQIKNFNKNKYKPKTKQTTKK